MLRRVSHNTCYTNFFCPVSIRTTLRRSCRKILTQRWSFFMSSSSGLFLKGSSGGRYYSGWVEHCYSSRKKEQAPLLQGRRNHCPDSVPLLQERTNKPLFFCLGVTPRSNGHVGITVQKGWHGLPFCCVGRDKRVLLRRGGESMMLFCLSATSARESKPFSLPLPFLQGRETRYSTV